MKIFFDTNVLIAAFVAHGVCSDLFEHCLTEHTICISQQVPDKFSEKVVKKLRFPKPLMDSVITFLRKNTVSLSYSPLSSSICRDPDDDNILTAAISGKVDCLISGDEDLLVLKKVQGIPILKPKDFWKFEKRKSRNPRR